MLAFISGSGVDRQWYQGFVGFVDLSRRKELAIGGLKNGRRSVEKTTLAFEEKLKKEL